MEIVNYDNYLKHQPNLLKEVKKDPEKFKKGTCFSYGKDPSNTPNKVYHYHIQMKFDKSEGNSNPRLIFLIESTKRIIADIFYESGNSDRIKSMEAQTSPKLETIVTKGFPTNPSNEYTRKNVQNNDELNRIINLFMNGASNSGSPSKAKKRLDFDEKKAEGDSGEKKAEGDSGEKKAEGDSGEKKAEGDSGEKKAEGKSGEKKAEGDSGEKKAEGDSGEKKAEGQDPAQEPPVEGQAPGGDNKGWSRESMMAGFAITAVALYGIYYVGRQIQKGNIDVQSRIDSIRKWWQGNNDKQTAA